MGKKKDCKKKKKKDLKKNNLQYKVELQMITRLQCRECNAKTLVTSDRLLIHMNVFTIQDLFLFTQNFLPR